MKTIFLKKSYEQKSEYINITDKQLIRHVFKTAKILDDLTEILDPDTKDKLETVYNVSENIKQSSHVSETFFHKIPSNQFVPLWTCLIQDSIMCLKEHDLREDMHWHSTKEEENEVHKSNNRIVFGLDKVHKYFSQFTTFEQVLYGIDRNYRDHIAHVFRVWLMGIFFLYQKVDDNRYFIDTINLPRLIKNQNHLEYYSNLEKMAMWCIIALCHDLGYPLEKSEKINEEVEKMLGHIGKMNIQRFSAAFQLENQFLNKFLLDFISSKIEIDDQAQNHKLIKEIKSYYCGQNNNDLKIRFQKALLKNGKYYSNAIQTKYYIKFAKSLESYRHGIISSSILLKLLVYFLESDFNLQEKARLSFEDARQFAIRHEILRAIAAHTCPEVYHLHTNTMAFLLILCDELQEWDRPNFVEMRSNDTYKKELSIHSFKADKIAFALTYSGIEDKEAKKSVKKVFRRWHEILRSAIDDGQREKMRIDFKIVVVNEQNDRNTEAEKKQAYRFQFRNNRLYAYTVDNTDYEDKWFDEKLDTHKGKNGKSAFSPLSIYESYESEERQNTNKDSNSNEPIKK